MENTLNNIEKWIEDNQKNYPKVFKSQYWLKQILLDYGKQVKLFDIHVVVGSLLDKKLDNKENDDRSWLIDEKSVDV